MRPDPTTPRLPHTEGRPSRSRRGPSTLPPCPSTSTAAPRLLALTLLALGGILSLAGSAGAQVVRRPPQSPRQVNLWVARDAAPGPKVRLNMNTRNLAQVRVTAHRLEGIQWLIRRSQDANNTGDERNRPAVTGKPVREWTINMVPPGERPNPNQSDAYRSRQVNLPEMSPGVYLLTAYGGQHTVWAVVNITHLAVIVKRSPKRILAWVTDHVHGGTVKGASVGLYNGAGGRLTGATTQANGIATFTAAPGRDQTLIVSRGKEFAGVATGIEDPDGVLHMHFQTDRPIYRPGNTVFFKAILRRTLGRGYVPVANTACTVQVRDARDNPIDTFHLTTNSIGSLAGEEELPAEGVLGPYTVTVTAGRDTAYGQFSVAEYRKPEFKVTVQAQARRYLAGEDAAFDVQASYYFGAPVPQAAVHYQIRRSPNPYGGYEDASGWYAGGDGNLYPRDTYASQPFVGEGTVYTDEAGRVTIPVKTQKDLPDTTYSVSVQVEDASHRRVEGSASVPVYSAAVRLSISSELMLAPLGTIVPLQLRAADLDGRPVAALVTITPKHWVWTQAMQQYLEVKEAPTQVQIPASGRANAQIAVNVLGDVVLEATTLDATGRKAVATMSIWAVGPDMKIERPNDAPNLTIRLDRRAYRPGETARAWITTNQRGRPVLVTAEGGDLWDYVVVPANRAGFLWTVTTSLEMSPNAYVTANQWIHAADPLSASALLPVPDESRRLTVRIEPERTNYRPGDPATYLVRTLDANGRPTAAEVAFSVVDEAIYALRPDTTPEPYGYFWGQRPNGTATVYSAPEEVSGGAYQRANALAPIRQQFLDTAYWNPFVATGGDGTARVTFEFPGNLTSWRATALAVTAETQGGRATTNVQVSRPVMLRLATPRLIVQGDHLTLTGTINNRTNAAHEFEAELAVDGLRLESDAKQRAQVPAGSEGRVQWKLAADTLPASGQARILGVLEAMDAPADQRKELSDALRVPLRVVPRGIQERIVSGTVVGTEGEFTLTLPPDRIEPASVVTLGVSLGLGQVAQENASSVLASPPYGSLGAANVLLAASSEAQPDLRAVRDAVALLSRFQKPDGTWGWWDNDPSDAKITARVLEALGTARDAHLVVPQTLIQRGINGAVQMYAQTNLWEDRALLAAALARAGFANDRKYLDEVTRRGTFLSPFARLRVAEEELNAGGADAARQILNDVLKEVVAGPETAYLPLGDRPGWSATTAEATAELLVLLSRLKMDLAVQRKLAEWLARPEEGTWRTPDEQARIASRLAEYVRSHPDAAEPGELRITVNGSPVPTPDNAHPDRPLRIDVPRAVLQSGPNQIEVRRTGTGELFVSAEARVFRPAHEESRTGLRVLRRFEVQNGAGVWEDVRGPVKTSQPVRVSVIVWPEDRQEGIRLSEPIPAGFEFIDSEGGSWAREEVRDGAVVHYLRPTGWPISFRYYLRAESGGDLVALPAVGEVLRRPRVRGHSSEAELSVEAAR